VRGKPKRHGQLVGFWVAPYYGDGVGIYHVGEAEKRGHTIRFRSPRIESDAGHCRRHSSVSNHGSEIEKSLPFGNGFRACLPKAWYDVNHEMCVL